jgi:protein required for attachment to host cells
MVPKHRWEANMVTPVPADDRRYLVVVADEYRAIIYARDTFTAPLRKLRTYTNETARMKTGELLSDRGGRSFDSHGQGRHTMGSDRDAPQQQFAKAFAKDIAQVIAAEFHKGMCRGYAVIAAPRFLGLLRQEFATVLKHEPYATVDKDVVDQDENFIGKLLENA